MLLMGLIVVLIAVGLDTAPAALSPAATSARPTLAVSSMNPLRVLGRGFKSGERVVVSLGTRRRTATADTRGRFSVGFGRVRCLSGTIRAVGSKGSRAATSVPKTLCFNP